MSNTKWRQKLGKEDLPTALEHTLLGGDGFIKNDWLTRCTEGVKQKGRPEITRMEVVVVNDS